MKQKKTLWVQVIEETILECLRPFFVCETLYVAIARLEHKRNPPVFLRPCEC